MLTMSNAIYEVSVTGATGRAEYATTINAHDVASAIQQALAHDGRMGHYGVLSRDAPGAYHFTARRRKCNRAASARGAALTC